VGDGVGATREIVDERHLAEVITDLQDGQRLLAHAGNLAADAHRARENDEELVARGALGEDRGAARVGLLDTEAGDAPQVHRRQIREEADLGQARGDVLVFGALASTSTAGVSSTIISGSLAGSTGGVLSLIAPKYATARPRLPGEGEKAFTTETQRAQRPEKQWVPDRDPNPFPSIPSLCSLRSLW